MGPDRGHDAATEQRRIQPRQEKEGLEAWLEDVFFGGGEATVLGLPALFLLVSVESGPAVKLAALFAWPSLSLAVGTVRGGRVGFAPAWLPKTRRTVPFLLVFHTAVLLGAAFGGARAAATTGSALASMAVAVAVPFVAVAGVARLAVAVGLDGRR